MPKHKRHIKDGELRRPNEDRVAHIRRLMRILKGERK